MRALRGVLALMLLLSIVTIGTSAAGADSSGQTTFIVTLRDGNPRAVAAEHAQRYGADIEFVYEHALQGYAARVSEARIGELARDGRVARIERDQVVQAVGEQTGATWGLDRIDQRALPLSTTYTYNASGAGVTAYIIDTGIRISHQDFGPRARDGYDAVDRSLPAADCNGHGTHVAGTVGGTTYGVAKGVALVAVRVLDCQGSGTWSGVIAGIDWVTGNAAKPAVANMSLGGGASASVDDAVRRSITSGVSYAVAAGNGNQAGIAQDACGYSPARVAEAMTIGATTKTDAKTSWSNYGSCVDWFAPGYQITSAWYTNDTATNTISGTSMATPHTAGAAALLLEASPSASPQTVRDTLYEWTTEGAVTSSSTANNHLLYTLGTGSGGGGGGGGTVTDVTISGTCDKTACTFTATAAGTWTGGDGLTGSGTTAAHTYPQANGSYGVRIDVSPTVSDTASVTCAKKGRWYHCSVSG